MPLSDQVHRVWSLPRIPDEDCRQVGSLFSLYGFLLLSTQCLKDGLRQKNLMGDGIYRIFEYIVSLVSCEPWIRLKFVFNNSWQVQVCSARALGIGSVPRFAVFPSVLD